MDIKKKYMTPEAVTVDCCTEAMIATSGVDENEIIPGDAGYDGKFQSNGNRGWGDLWK